MPKYPLLFTFLDKVEGNDYLAEVAVHGRLLAVQEGDAWWAYGVNPGGVAAEGASMAEAYISFRKAVMEVLFDIAIDAKDFYAFRASARQFFDETDEATIKEWEVAREEVRAGKLAVDGLRRETAEAPRRIEISQKQTFAAKHNATDPQASVAA